MIKPDVVLYEEGLDQQVLSQAVQAIREAEVLIVGGTSLTVYPAAGLIDYYRGNKLVLINKSETGMDGKGGFAFERAGVHSWPGVCRRNEEMYFEVGDKIKDEKGASLQEL